MKKWNIIFILVLCVGCGQTPERVDFKAKSKENFELIASKYSLRNEILIRLLQDYDEFTGLKSFSNYLFLRDQEASKAEKVKLEKMVDVPTAINLLSKEYNISETAISSLMIDLKLLERCRCDALKPKSCRR